MTHSVSPKRLTFDPNTVEIFEVSTGNMIVKGDANCSFKEYEVSHYPPASYLIALFTHANNISKLWHEKFGHLNFKYLQQLHNDQLVDGFPLIKSSEEVCPGCWVGKHPEKKHEVGKATRASSTLDIKHSDVLGPIPTTSMNGSRYFLEFINDCSRYC